MSDREAGEALNIKMRNNADNRQFTVEVDGRDVGRAEYRIRGETYLFIHTEVDPEFQGLGLADRLARFALDDVRDQGRALVPICPFIAAYIKRHPEYDEIVDHELTNRLKRRRGGEGDRP